MAAGAAWPVTASARPLIDIPPSVGSLIERPCVLYSCATDPQAHTNWENTLGTVPEYCALYHCDPMDLVPTNGFDDNLFPLNPDWAFATEHQGQPPDPLALCNGFPNFLGSLSHLGSPPCTSYPVSNDQPGEFTEASVVCPLGRSPQHTSFHGHVNWEPATYQGDLIWESKSDVGSDDDYSFDLETVGGHGATTGNSPPGSIHLEFDSDETIDHFDSSAWWQHFHHIVDNGYGAANPNTIGIGKPHHHAFDSDQAHAADVGDFINGDFAVVTGLIGIDAAHTPAAESHPVYAMAIQTDKPQALAGGTDTWAIFARNWGNEGYCSSHDHPIPAGPLTIRVPWMTKATRPGQSPMATGVSITSTSDLWSNISRGSAGSVSIVPGVGVLLTLDLPSASAQPLYWGTIELKWTWSSAPPPAEPPSSSPFSHPIAKRGGTDDENSDVEAIAHRLWLRLPPTIRARAFASLPQPRLVLVSSHPKIAMVAPPESPLRPLASFVTPTVSHATLALGIAEFRALCTAFKNHVPGHPAMCARNRRI